MFIRGKDRRFYNINKWEVAENGPTDVHLRNSGHEYNSIEIIIEFYDHEECKDKTQTEVSELFTMYRQNARICLLNLFRAMQLYPNAAYLQMDATDPTKWVNGEALEI